MSLLALLIVLPASSRGDVYCDETTKRVHTADCPERQHIKKKNLKIFHAAAEAEAKGFYPCPICFVPVRGQSEPGAGHPRMLAKSIERGKDYIGDSETHLYHYQWCNRVSLIKPSATVVFKTAEKAMQNEFTPCKECNPPVYVKKAERIIVTPEPAGAKPKSPRPPSVMGGGISTGDEKDSGKEGEGKESAPGAGN
jgi:hypothetical protein